MGSCVFDLLWSISLICISVWLALQHPLDIEALIDNKNVSSLAVLNSLRKLKNSKIPIVKGSKLALGYNANVDVIVDAIELMQNLGLSPPPNSPYGEDRQHIATREDLSYCFKYFFSAAAAGERFVTNKDLFDEITEALYKSDYTLRVGGNAALMATTLIEDFGFDVIVGGQVGPTLSKLMPSEMNHIGRREELHAIANSPVQVRNDEIHIIMEYKKGSKWGAGDVVKRANRFIISNDLSNAALAPLEPLNEYITTFHSFNESNNSKMKLLSVSGIHMLDGQSKQFRTERLADVQRNFDKIQLDTIIHYEHASIGDESLIEDIGEIILSRVDSLGLNEQEMATLYSALGGKFDGTHMTQKTLSATIPDPQLISDAIEHIYRVVKPSSRMLSRIHFHCFGYHIIAQRSIVPAPANLRKWDNSKEAAASGSIKASERACNSSDLGIGDVEQYVTSIVVNGKYMDLSPENPIAVWSTEGSRPSERIDFVLVPVLACAVPVQTVGLGDAISASAIAYQL